MKFESRVAREEPVVSPRIDPHEVEADQAADAVIGGKSAAIRGHNSLGLRGAPSGVDPNSLNGVPEAHVTVAPAAKPYASGVDPKALTW